MVRICQTHRPNPSEPFNDTEDAWLSRHVTVYPDDDYRCNHIMESILVDDPYILHQFWTFAHCYLAFGHDEFIAIWQKLLLIQ